MGETPTAEMLAVEVEVVGRRRVKVLPVGEVNKLPESSTATTSEPVQVAFVIANDPKSGAAVPVHATPSVEV